MKTRRGVTLGIAVILFLLIYFGAALLFNRTNPGREVQMMLIQWYLSFPPPPLFADDITRYWRGRR